MRRSLLIALLATAGMCFSQTKITGQQVVVSGSGTIYVFVANSILVSPSTYGAPVGTTVQYSALAVDAFGDTAPVCTSSGWTSTDTGKATISSTGLASGVAPGATTIQCSVGSISGTAALTVLGTPTFTNPVTPCSAPCPLSSGTVGNAYSYTVTAAGSVAPYIFSLVSGSFPSGLSMSSGGLISGTPVSGGTSLPTIQVCDSLSACTSLQVSIVITTGTVTYSAYTGNAIVTPWPNIPNMGAATRNNAVYTDSSYPSGTPSPVIRCTDSLTAPNFVNHSFSAGYGGSGDAVQLFNADDTLLHVNVSGGSDAIIPILSSGQCGAAITKDKNLTNPGSSSQAFNFGDGTFNWTDRTIYYSYNGVDTTKPEQYTFANVTTGTFNDNGPFADMDLGLPLGNNAPAWQSAHAYTTGQYVTVTGTWPNWQANHTYQPGDIIKPLTNNVWGCAFYMSQSSAKVSGGTNPSFSTTPQGQCVTPSNTTITDGTAKWRNLSGPGAFTYQLTSAGGTSGVGIALPLNPALMTTISDNGLTWTNTGVAYSPGWASYGGVSRDGTRMCAAFSNNGYSYAGSFTGYTGGQDSGQYVVCYDKTANKYHLLNTVTGYQHSTSCAGGTGYNCSGGTLSFASDGLLNFHSTCGFFLHNDKGTMGGDYQLLSHQQEINGTCNSAMVWRPFAAFDAANNAKFTSGTFSHAAIGASHLQALFTSNTTFYGSQTGMSGLIYDMANPTSVPPISLQTSPCTPNPFVSGLPPPCDPAYWDQHMGWAYHPDSTDTQPACGTIYNLKTLSPVPVAPWQGEEVCVTTSPTWTNIATPGAQTMWRFTHTLATGSNPNMFDAQFQISQMSGTGKKLAFTSDWGCTLGSTDGLATVCGPPWLPGFTYHVNDLVGPVGATGGTGAIFNIFKVTTAGTSGTSFPGFATPNAAWSSCSGIVGCTITDSNGVVYTNVNGKSSNARGDVFIVQLAP